jgi:uncharacterized protein (TIRG00374 family)
VRSSWRGALGIVVSAALLWWVLHDQDLGALWTTLAGSSAPLWLACTVFATLIFPLRARRWQALLAPTYGRLPVGELWRATAIGMMVNNVVGFRTGEPARAFVLSRAEPRVRFTAAFGSLAVDRLFDGTVVVLLMLVATFDPRFPSGHMVGDRPLSAYLVPASGFLGVVLAGALFLLFAPAWTARMIDGVVGRLAPGVAPRVHHVFEGFVEGLHVLRSPVLIVEVLFWALLHWLCNAFAFWLGFRALGIDAPFSAGLLVQGLIAIGVAAPSTPGFFGVFEFFGRVGLAIYGVDNTQVVVWVLAFHILSWIPISLIGGWYLTRMRLSLSDLRSGGINAPPAPPTGA